ncbi:Hypothetical protein NTJ_00548 [Nesidiocoris tenuis]|uniref:Uncharacterized protein n=1 Tax=Nesidiocoris tenuis TaxID=355587 RepID=A0ABN7ABV6_9HEMI|nr:Hypothetical protein NTJ_00548 [Nesidiocoris tenuis]
MAQSPEIGIIDSKCSEGFGKSWSFLSDAFYWEVEDGSRGAMGSGKTPCRFHPSASTLTRFLSSHAQRGLEVESGNCWRKRERSTGRGLRLAWKDPKT